VASCRQAGCTAPQGDRCLEGFEVASDCPHYLVEEVAVPAPEPVAASNATADRSVAPSPAFIPIHAGESLGLTDATAITRATRTNVVVVAGAEDSGKTSLIASLYQLFLNGEMEGFGFAGSATLMGFERRCYLTRMAIDRDTADTPRTPTSDGTKFLHLRVHDIASDRCFDFLFSDISGELFRLARDHEEDAKSLKVVRRADHLAVLFDGRRMTQPAERQNAVREGSMLLRSFVEAGMVGQWTSVQLVLTKVDVVNTSQESGGARFAEVVLTEIAQKFQERLGRITIHRVAALPVAETQTAFGFGLVELLSTWLTRVEVTDKRTRGASMPTAKNGSEFSKFESRWRALRE
jgi:hypothetical protein